MKTAKLIAKLFFFLLAAFFLCCLTLMPAWANGSTVSGLLLDDSIEVSKFGRLHILRPDSTSSDLVILATGDGGWNPAMRKIAEAIAQSGFAVAVFDVRTYLRSVGRQGGSCAYVAVDFENLSHSLQQSLHFPGYIRPVLAGYSSGATLVYGALGQSPPGTFAGAISLGFCPDLKIPRRICPTSDFHSAIGKKRQTFILQPKPDLEERWVAFQGGEDRECLPDETRKFVSSISRGSIVELPAVGHGFKNSALWIERFKVEAHAMLTEKNSAAVDDELSADLRGQPLITIDPVGQPNGELAVIISGDGGWAGLDRELARGLALKGMRVIGLDSLKYFWTKRSLAQTADTLEEIIEYFTGKYGLKSATLAGYSFGANIIPFIVNRLPDHTRGKIRLIALLAPDATAQLEFHFGNWLGVEDQTKLMVGPEVEKISGPQISCYWGSEEDQSPCPELGRHGANSVKLPGGHHFNGDFKKLADLIAASPAYNSSFREMNELQPADP